MVKDNEQYAYFAVAGDLDPDEVTARTGVPPTERWRRGDVCPRTYRERTSGRWSLHSRLGRDQELEAHIRDVLAQLNASPDAFQAVSREFGGWVQLVAYLHQNYPGLHFGQDITEGLAQYSLSVDFDFYWLYSSRREATDA